MSHSLLWGDGFDEEASATILHDEPLTPFVTSPGSIAVDGGLSRIIACASRRVRFAAGTVLIYRLRAERESESQRMGALVVLREPPAVDRPTHFATIHINGVEVARAGGCDSRDALVSLLLKLDRTAHCPTYANKGAP